MYLAHIARDPSIPIPVQPNSSAVLAIFMLIGVFGLTYVRIKFAQGKTITARLSNRRTKISPSFFLIANFGVIFASMIVAVKHSFLDDITRGYSYFLVFF